uniref:Uncharacterized protein n=1 Tax=Arundo donax TaxID=35708 RepID=A0A0A9ARC2_ARUDO
MAEASKRNIRMYKIFIH